MEKYFNSYPIQSIGIDDSSYPAELKSIPDAPALLYFRGNLDLTNQKCFAIVGTRRCSEYGKEIAFNFAGDLSRAGLVIVSGLASGVDTWAHKGALEANRPQGSANTIGVLGTGLSEKCFYPQENLALAKNILEKGGCLVSEYPENTQGSNFTFPRRNRIIASISLGVLVVEAKVKSGALITASYARKYHKKVLAIPGNIHSQNSQGCHFLIQQGATLTQSPQNILKALGISAAQKSPVEPANETEKIILNLLWAEGNLTIDKIIEKSQLEPSKVSSALSLMELTGKVKNLGANTYTLI
jgi:DNA processing protein